MYASILNVIEHRAGKNRSHDLLSWSAGLSGEHKPEQDSTTTRSRAPGGLAGMYVCMYVCMYVFTVCICMCIENVWDIHFILDCPFSMGSIYVCMILSICMYVCYGYHMSMYIIWIFVQATKDKYGNGVQPFDLSQTKGGRSVAEIQKEVEDKFLSELQWVSPYIHTYIHRPTFKKVYIHAYILLTYVHTYIQYLP